MKLINSLFENPLVFIDIETTGLRPTYDRIIEIGIVKIINGKVVKKFNTLVNPGVHLPPEIIQITGITSEELENAPSFRLIKDTVLELLSNSIFVAHNARFDYSFIKNEFKRLQVNYSTKPLCSAKLSRTLFPRFRRHNLDSLIERFNLKCPNRHRAYGDAHVIYQFFKKIESDILPDKWSMAIKRQLKTPSLPQNLKSSDLENLPEKPGVYIFYGKSNTPLYVGKSINIRDRVLSHFNSDHQSSKEMRISQQIESLETIATAGELGALLLESSLIKKFQPIYNRKLRQVKSLISVKKFKDIDGYYRTVLDDALINPLELDQVLGIFSSIKTAKSFLIQTAKEYQLCEKLLGVEKTRAECFGFRLGRCKGACRKQEPIPFYNLRFDLAFSKTKLKNWPFNGPILLKEKNPLENTEEIFIVDQWCIIGSGKSDEDLTDLKSHDYNFDLDNYKILNSFLKSANNLKSLQVMKFFGNQQGNKISA